MNKVVAVFLLALGSNALFAETRLSGEIQVASLDASGNPYLVEKDVVVPAGKSLTIKAGCIFLFSGFSGLNASGNLTVEGSVEKPVIFTCINDNDYNQKSQQLPNPFDWNGIIIAKESGSIHFQNFQLRYSVYGIKSQNTSMTIQNGIFRQNGQFHFTLNDKIQYVQDNISYTFNAATDPDKKKAESQTDQGSQKSGSNTRNIVRWVSFGVGVAGIIGGTIFTMQAINTSKDIDNFDTGKYPTQEGNALWSDMDNKLHTQSTLAIVCFSFSGVGFAGFAATFLF
jgi:hypothetical protein